MRKGKNDYIKEGEGNVIHGTHWQTNRQKPTNTEKNGITLNYLCAKRVLRMDEEGGSSRLDLRYTHVPDLYG